MDFSQLPICHDETLKYFNSATITKYSPYKLEEKGIWIPTERIHLLSNFLLSQNIHFFVDDNEFQFISHNHPTDFLKEIKLNVQEEFNFDRWYFKIKGLKLKYPNSDLLYDPLPNAYFISLTDEQIAELKKLSKKRKYSKIQRKQKRIDLDWDSNDEKLYKQYAQFFDEKIEDYKIATKTENVEFFLRLSGRSPKDILIHLFEPSRTGEDVTMRLTNSTRANCCFTEYLKLPINFRSLKVIFLPLDMQINLALEFRCFINNRKF